MTKLKNLSLKQLKRRMEQADDFDYDDETAEMQRRGIEWKWSDDLHNPKVIILDQN